MLKIQDKKDFYERISDMPQTSYRTIEGFEFIGIRDYNTRQGDNEKYVSLWFEKELIGSLKYARFQIDTTTIVGICHIDVRNDYWGRDFSSLLLEGLNTQLNGDIVLISQFTEAGKKAGLKQKAETILTKGNIVETNKDTIKRIKELSDIIKQKN